MPNRFYSSTSVSTTLNGSITSSQTSMQIVSTVGMPGSFPYTLIIEPDTLSEEVVTVTAGSGTTLTVTRGDDGTTNVSHTTGAKVVHGVSARDFREPQAHITATADVHGVTGALASASSVTSMGNSKVDKSTLAAKGTLLAASASGTPVGVAVGTDGQVVTADSTQTSGLKYGPVPAVKSETVGVCVYTGGAYPTRPSGYGSVQFVGPVSPGGAMVDGDTWVNTA